MSLTQKNDSPILGETMDLILLSRYFFYSIKCIYCLFYRVDFKYHIMSLEC